MSKYFLDKTIEKIEQKMSKNFYNFVHLIFRQNYRKNATAD